MFERHGANPTPDQCKVKLKNLKRLYQERRRVLARSGAGAVPAMPHQDLLDELLGGRPSTAAASGEMGLDLTFQNEGNSIVNHAIKSSFYPFYGYFMPDIYNISGNNAHACLIIYLFIALT